MNSRLTTATRNSLLLFAGCLAFHLLGTWSLPLIDRDEPRFAEASREMMQRGDYVVPFFNNAYRFDKPPFTYWAQVASYRVFGDNDFAARFPSCVAAATCALLLLHFGRRLRNARVGWASAIIFTFSAQVAIHAKAAVADMWLVLFVTAAHWAGAELLGLTNSRTRTAQRIAWFAFWIALALAFLAKGPIGWTPLLTVLAFAIWKRRKPRSAAVVTTIAGLTLMMAIVCAWGIPALLRTHGEFFRVGIGKHVVARSVSAMEGHGASSPLMYVVLLPFYFVTLFATLLPWSLKLPRLVRVLRLQHDERDDYLIIGTLFVFGIFTLVATKLPHYTLPVFPLLALLLAQHAVTSRFLRNAAIFAGVADVAVALIVPPLIAPQFPAPTLLKMAAADLTSETQLAAVDFTEPTVVWYFRQRIAGYMQLVRARDVAAFLAEPGPRAAMMTARVANERLTNRPPDWKFYTTRGRNFGTGRTVDLTMVVKRE